MEFLTIVIVFIVGGVIYNLIKTDDSSQVLEGAANGFFLLTFLLRKIFPYALILLIFIGGAKACS